MSYATLRRYTPPTCTLEIMAKNSPLSRWSGQPVLKHLRFQLRLDDPKLPDEQWLTLRGDRAQLEALHEAVSTYVQQFLEQSYDLEASYRRPSQESAGAAAPEAIAVLPAAAPRQTFATSSKAMALQPEGLLAHKLALGSLATPNATDAVSLSTLQLFDLANALDDYAADLLALPDLQRSHQLTPSSLHWGQIAATGLVVIGLSATVAKIIESSLRPASPTATQEASRAESPLAMQLPPPITSGQKLPPPPPLGATVPASPGLPTFPLASPLPSRSISPNAGKPPAGTIQIQPVPGAGSVPNKAAGNQIAMVPQESRSSASARSQPTQPMPAPLTLNREFAKGSPSQSASAPAASGRVDDAGAQADQTGTAFDTIPQIAEARQYFQQRWTPPQGLTQTLEYTLLVNANGSMQRAVPLGQAAGDYVDRTGIPLAGEAFVSALKGGRNAKIRLVLSPDGSVKTFLEGFY